MKSGIPWNLKRVDEDTRRAVIEAARRSGVSVGEWLSEVLVPHGQSQAQPDQPQASADLAASMAEIKGRLDDIERGLHRPQAPRTQKSVAEMVADLAREIESPDERARSSVEGLRGRSGVAAVRAPVDDNRFADALRALDRQIADMSLGTAARASPPRADHSQVHLDDIRFKLDALLAQGPKPEPPPPSRRPEPVAAVEAALKVLESRIDDAKAGLEQRRETQSPTTEHLARLEAQLADIGARLSTADPRHPRKEAELAAAIREIATHQRTLDDRAETFALRRDQKALSASIAAIRADIAALAEQVGAIGRVGGEEHGAFFELAHRIDVLEAETPADRNLLVGIRGDLESLREMIEANAREMTFTAARNEGVAAQVNALLAGSPNRKQVEALGEEVAALREILEADASPGAIKQLEARIAEVGRGVEAVLTAQQGSAEPSPVLEQLEERLREISARMETLREPVMPLAVSAAIASAQHQVEARLDDLASRLSGLFASMPRQTATLHTLEEKLEAVVERIDDLSLTQQEPSQALDLIQSEIRALRAELSAREGAVANTDHLEAQIRDLARHLETVAASTPDAGALAGLERQVEILAGELEEARPHVAAVATLEQNLTRLQSLLAEATRESIVGARTEAQQAVTQLSELIAEYEIDSDLVRSLMRDLEALRNTAGSSDETTHAQLKTVGQTLTEVIERLGRLERQALGGAQERPSATLAIVSAPTDATADVVALSATTTADKPVDRRADFISAARRAAHAAASRVPADQIPPVRSEQAMAAEAAAIEPPEERRRGAFARISQAIRNRKRSLLLAAAAIVIAISAMQLFGKFATGPRENASTASAAVAAAPVAVKPAAAVREASSTPAVPALPQVAETEKVSAAATPNSAIAFAEPVAIDNRFAAAPNAPEASAFATDAALPKPPPADEAAGYYASGLDPRLGDDRLLRAADDGDPAAAFEVARRYAEGAQLPTDLGKAAEWYRRAAEGGVAVAQYRLASLHERGQGVAEDRVEAVNWYQRAADQGNVSAMHNLAVMLSEGVESPPDHDKALQWFLAAANYGVRDSQYNLGVIYARGGMGPAQDLVESYKWFAVAAAQGDKDAAERRAEVGKAMSREELAAAEEAIAAWHVQPTLAEANGVTSPEGGWDGPGDGFALAQRQALVKKIQILLAEQGYDPGPADGVAGPKTVDAVRAYQRRIGRPETGEIDSTLVAALDNNRM